MSILSEIVAYKKSYVQSLKPIAKAQVCQHDFMTIFERFAVIAECKAKSPSAGKIVEFYDALAHAQQYVQADADAISVLTDEKYFAGSYADLQTIHQEINLPLLCKDFIIDEKQVHYARAAGASACLLIMAILEDQQAQHLKKAVEELGMVAVIEVFNEEEIARALLLQPQVLLINNRNLHSFNVSFADLQKLVDKIPDSVKVISASGIRQPQDCVNLPEGVDGVLIGAALMQAENKKDFIGACHDKD